MTGTLPAAPVPAGAAAIRILLLEDSDLDAELLAAHLAKAGLCFHLTRVTGRREFVAALEAGECDIVLADYSLPDFDGLSALNIARALQPDIPFVFVSGVVGEEFATNALKRGAADYVMKRNLTRLATAVDRALVQAAERTERRRTEEALRRSEARARLAAEAAQLGLVDYDPVSRDLAWDARCQALFGLAPGAPVSFGSFLAGCHPDDRERMRRALAEVLTWRPGSDGAFAEEFRTRAADGRERWVTVLGQAQFEAGTCTRFLGVVRDITEERRAREALRDLASALERQVAERTAERDSLWRLSPDLFAVLGTDGRLRRVNPAWRNLLGHDPEALIGTSFALLLHPDDQAAAAAMLDPLAPQPPPQLQTRVRGATGEWRWISWRAAPEGDAIYAVGRDIAAERQAALDLAERNRELAAQIEERERVEHTLRQMQRLEAVGQLTSGVAHDFNNLLTVILGNLALLERTLSGPGVPARTAERIGYMRAAAERGAKLTAQLLAFSRRQKLEPKPVDLNETVSGMRELLQSTLGGSIRIELVRTPGLWPALVDPTQIELIILNLAINARDAMEVGGALTLETANVTLTRDPVRPEEPPPGEYVRLAVNDTGPGMTPEVLARAFEPFFTTKEVGRGSGLGLAQVYGFAKQSGGGVRIDTVPGEGTSVKVFLPRAARPGAAPPEPEPEPAAPARAVAGPTVLLVDDDAAVREVTSALLADLGCTVLAAGSGTAGLDLLRARPGADLLMVDYAMPGMNGAEVAARARALRPGLPVLFITGYADLKALRDVGEERIVRKPFQDGELARKLTAALRPAPGDPAPGRPASLLGEVGG